MRLAVHEVVQVLNSDDVGDLTRLLDLVDAHLGKPERRDLPLVLHGLQLADLVGQWYLPVDAMQLQQVDAIDAEAAQAHLDLLAQVRRASDHMPLARAGTHEAGLRRDEHLLRVRVQRLAQDLLAHVRTVRISGVDEVDAELDRAPHDANALVAVGRLAPDARAGQLHRAEAEAVHGLAGDGERAGPVRGDGGRGVGQDGLQGV